MSEEDRLNEPNYDWDDDYGFLYTPQPRRSLFRAAAVTILALMTVVGTVSLLTYRHHGAMFSGRMQLVSVSVVFRHGAQTSENQQTWEEQAWPEGFGELTVKGMQQMYSLGRKIRSRYVDTLKLLPKDTQGARDAVQMRSTGLDLTTESAISALLGLFDHNAEGFGPMPEVCKCRPRSGDHRQRLSNPECVSECIGLTNSLLASQIPDVETLIPQRDWLLQQHRVCDGWEQGPDSGEVFEKAVYNHRQAFDDAVQFLGADRLCYYQVENGTKTARICTKPPLKLRDLEPLYQNLLNAESANKECPKGVGMDCRQLLAKLHPIREFLWNYDFESANAVHAGGMLAGEILENMKRARKYHMTDDVNTETTLLQRPPALYLYSAEDTNVAALLGTFKAPWFHAPLFGSYVAVELWAPRTGDMSNEELWMVNVRYDGRPLKKLPGCDKGFCKFKDFFYSLFWTQAMYEEDCLPPKTIPESV